MKKLKLDELEVKSLTTSVDAQEETKGGTTAVCAVTATLTFEMALLGGLGAAAVGGYYYFNGGGSY